MQPNSINIGLMGKYAPRTLSQIVGQPMAVRSLSEFVDAPHSAGFIFHGPTGVGKTASAHALALDLGCNDDYDGFGGISQIPSGKQDGRAVEVLMKNLRIRPMFGSGWKVAIINEADCMTPQAEEIWLDALESLPPRSVIVFTTNDIRKLSRRLVGRCEAVKFDGESDEFVSGMEGLVRWIWKTETGKALKSVPENLGRYELADTVYSIRLAMQQLAPMIRTATLTTEISVPFIRDSEVIEREKRQSAARKAVATRRSREGVSA